MAARVLLRLAAWTGEGRYRDAAERAIRSVVPFVSRYPTGFAQWLSAMDLALAPVARSRSSGSPGTRRRPHSSPRRAGVSVRTRSRPSPPIPLRAPSP